MVDMQLDNLNFAIQTTQNRIDRLCRLNDNWIARTGEENEGLNKQIEDLQKELDELLRERRKR